MAQSIRYLNEVTIWNSKYGGFRKYLEKRFKYLEKHLRLRFLRFKKAKILDVLAKYDLFQYHNNIKPDYCNAGGLVMKEGGEWVDWCDEETGEDNPEEFVKQQGAITQGEITR